MDQVVEVVRWWNLACYLVSMMALVYKFILSIMLDDNHEFQWIKLVLCMHLFLGFFFMGEIIYNNTERGFLTFPAFVICSVTVWVCLFKIKVQDDCSR